MLTDVMWKGAVKGVVEFDIKSVMKQTSFIS